jgi:hypothetical protein
MDVAYRYPTASTLRSAGQGAELLLATSGGVTEAGPALHPYFFRGFLTEPGPAAQALLACAAVARANYVSLSALAALMADPVATSNTDRLRFESFSECCGVHARLDLLPAALDGEPVTSGTTNVDFNPQMRAALAGVVAGRGQMLLGVGSDEVTVTTEAVSVTERQVALPPRWVKGFGEVQALAAEMRLVAEVAGADAGRFIGSLPRTARHPLWAVQAGRSLSLTTTPRPGAACVAGPQRLAEFRPLLRFARALRVYSPPISAGSLPLPSAWELDLGAARFTLTLSPHSHRGFTGEGALLGTLASADSAAADDDDLLGVLLAWEPTVDIARLAGNSGFSPERTVASLSRLAAAGRVGYDLADGAFFHRELPFTLRESDHPRLVNARAMVAAGEVRRTEGGAVVGDGDAAHRVTFGESGDTCTCPWWGTHQGTRGPCKHVLAARIAAAAGTTPGTA